MRHLRGWTYVWILLNCLFTEPYLLAGKDSSTRITGVSYLEDPEHILNPTQAINHYHKGKFTASDSQFIRGSFSTSAYWLHFSIQNSTNVSQNIYLKVKNSYADFVDLYNVGDHIPQLISSQGDQVAFGEHRTLAPYPVFRLTVAPGTQYFLLRYHTQSALSIPLEISHMQDFIESNAKDFLVKGYIFGAMLIITGYNFFLFFSLRNKAYLYYSLYLLNVLLATLATTGHLKLFFFSENGISAPVNWGYLWFSNFAGIFMGLFNQEFLELKDRHIKQVKGIRLINVGLIAGTIVSLFNYAVGAQLSILVGLFLMPLLIYNSAVSCLERYRAAYTYAVSWFFPIIGATIYLLALFGMGTNVEVGLDILRVAIICESILISIALAYKLRLEKRAARDKIANQLKDIENLNETLKQKHADIKELNATLERKVDEKTRDIRSIMQHIPLGVFTITGPNLNIAKDYSRHLSEMFGIDNLTGSCATDLIFNCSHLSSDEINQAVQCISSSIGESHINFLANAKLLPIELRRTFENKQSHIYDLTWDPITDDNGDIVDKILVTIRDVTELRGLQEIAQDQQEELEFIGEILKISPQRFSRFIHTCHGLINENERLLEAVTTPEAGDLELLKLLFVNMHTMKGTARSFYFKKMTKIFHEIEQYYAKLQSESEPDWDLERMRQDLRDARIIVSNYEQIAREKLGRNSQQAQIVEYSLNHIQRNYDLLSDIRHRNELSGEAQHKLFSVTRSFFERLFTSAREVFTDIGLCLPTLAKDLEKSEPKFELEDHDILMHVKVEEMIRNIFIHILRNSMDHGIESATERVRRGKDPVGLIRIELSTSYDRLKIRCFDDGRGLNLSRIREIGLRRELITPVTAAIPEHLADLIFDSGLSTSKRITDISGRGVGMDAVRRYLAEYGGTIRVIIAREKVNNDDFYPFELLIELPMNLFSLPLSETENQAA